MPAAAATDSWKPATPTSSGSSRITAVTASPRTRRPEAGRPSVQAVTAIMAMAVARSTDGSNRVTAANNRSSPIVAAQRVRAPSRRANGAAAASTNATFSPDTTSRWVRPDAAKSDANTGDSPRASPSTKPR